MDVLFKMGRCAGVCTGGEDKRTCGPFTAAAAEDAIKRGLQHPFGKHCMLMCFIGKLVANMGSGFLLEVLMEVPDDAELQMVVFGVGTTGFVALARAVAVLGKLEGNGVFCSARRMRLHVATKWEPCGHVLLEAMCSGRRFIVAPTGGLKNTAEDRFTDLWTDGKMTVEALVEHEFPRKGDPCKD